MKNFGRTIYKIIEEKRLVKKEIAEKIGLSPAYFSQLMNKETFDPATLEKICFAIGVSPGYFFDDWTSEKYTIGEINNQSVTGDATVNVGSNLESIEQVLKDKERIIEEKERLIKILLRQAGLSESIDLI